MGSTDPRILVFFDRAPGTVDGDIAWLVEGDAAAPGPIVERFTVSTSHQPGCACCLPRGAVAQALGRLFMRRARGEVACFRYVEVICSSAAAYSAAAAALENDVLVAARFRSAGMPG